MGHYKIANWGEFQHYKDRNPPWIKLHRDLLSSRTWVMLDDASRVLAVASMLLAAATDNQIPADPEYVKRVAYLNKLPDFAPLIKVGFIEYQPHEGEVVNNASKVEHSLAHARPEERRDREEGETEKREKRARVALADLSVDHVKDWLAQKRTQGRYLVHDEHFILEYFKNYCQAKGKAYADYVAAYRNAFEWAECQPGSRDHRAAQPKHPLRPGPAPVGKSSWERAADEIRARRFGGADAGGSGQAPVGHLEAVRPPEELRADGGRAGDLA